MTHDPDATIAALTADAHALAEAEPRFAPALEYTQRFPFRLRGPGFATLLQIILDQQVSTHAAAAMWAKFTARLDPVTPEGFLALEDETLKACGFSRQKTRYGRGLATALAEGTLDLEGLADLPDDEAIAALTALKGIGPWSAECYLLFGLGRRDVFPAGDLALQVGWQRIAALDARPSPAELLDHAEAWRPRRTAAAYLIWRHYLAQNSPDRATTG